MTLQSNMKRPKWHELVSFWSLCVRLSCHKTITFLLVLVAIHLWGSWGLWLVCLLSFGLICVASCSNIKLSCSQQRPNFCVRELFDSFKCEFIVATPCWERGRWHQPQVLEWSFFLTTTTTTTTTSLHITKKRSRLVLEMQKIGMWRLERLGIWTTSDVKSTKHSTLQVASCFRAFMSDEQEVCNAHMG